MLKDLSECYEEISSIPSCPQGKACSNDMSHLLGNDQWDSQVEFGYHPSEFKI